MTYKSRIYAVTLAGLAPFLALDLFILLEQYIGIPENNVLHTVLGYCFIYCLFMAIPALICAFACLFLEGYRILAAIIFPLLFFLGYQIAHMPFL